MPEVWDREGRAYPCQTKRQSFGEHNDDIASCGCHLVDIICCFLQPAEDGRFAYLVSPPPHLPSLSVSIYTFPGEEGGRGKITAI
eukprot:8013102-Pyramimonas_sp.AAC.1